jgi:hypothetical protein
MNYVKTPIGTLIYFCKGPLLIGYNQAKQWECFFSTELTLILAKRKNR